MTRIARLAAMGILIGFAGLSSGCLMVAAGAAGAGTVAYVEGASTAIVKADPPQVLKATKKTFNEMDIYVTDEQSSKLSAELDGKTSDDTSITMSVEKQGDGVSKVWVRVGIFGDRELSDTIFAHIKKNL